MRVNLQYDTFYRVKRILKPLLFNLVALFGAAQLIGGFSFGNDFTILIFSAVVFGMVSTFLKPILKAVTIPFNLLTLGLFSFLIDALLLYSTTRVVPGLTLSAFHFDGLQIGIPFRYSGISIPPMNVSTVGTLFLTSLIISVFVVTLGVIFGDE